MEVITGTRQVGPLPATREPAQHPLPKKTLSCFAPHTYIYGSELAQISFNDHLVVLDTEDFETDEEGLKLFTEKLQQVETITCLHLTGFAKHLRNDEFDGFIRSFLHRVCKKVKCLKVDETIFSLLPSRERLEENNLETIIAPGVNVRIVHESIPRSSYLKQLDVAVSHSNEARDLYPGVDIFLHGRTTTNAYTSSEAQLTSCKKRKHNETFTLLHRDELTLKRDLFAEYVAVHFFQHDTTVSLLPLRDSGDPKALSEDISNHFENQKAFVQAQQFLLCTNRRAEARKIKVAVLDTGVDYFHPALNGAIEAGKSYVIGENWFVDRNGHGTHCAGIIAGSNSGAAPCVRLLIAKVLDTRGNGKNDDIARGILWAIKKKANIISMSFGGKGYHQGTWKAIHEAIGAGIVVVCAAGNNGSYYRFNVDFPASIDSVIRVGSVNPKGAPAAFSAVGGPQIDAVALGVKVWSTWPCHDRVPRYISLSGTSMATPFIAAVCAWLLAYDRALNQNKLWNAHCMKDLLRQLCFNSSQEVAKGNGTPQLEHILAVPEFFIYLLGKIN